MALWERSVAIQHRLNLVERLLARGPLPTSRAQPAKIIASAVLAHEPAPFARSPQLRKGVAITCRAVS